MSRLAGSNEHGWVWSDERGLHVRGYVFDRFANYTIVGGIKTIVARKNVLDGISIVIAEVSDPPRVTAYHFQRQWPMDMVSTETHLFVAHKFGLKAFLLSNLTLVQVWPGSFQHLSLLPNNVLAVTSGPGTVSFLNYEENIWAMSSYAVNIESSLLDHRIMLSYMKPWCPEHKHRFKISFPQNCILATCDGLNPTYVNCVDGTYTVYTNGKPLWSFRAKAVDLCPDMLCIVDDRDIVVECPRRFWGARLAVLYLLTDAPYQLLLKVKKIL